MKNKTLKTFIQLDRDFENKNKGVGIKSTEVCVWETETEREKGQIGREFWQEDKGLMWGEEQSAPVCGLGKGENGRRPSGGPEARGTRDQRFPRSVKSDVCSHPMGEK